MMDASDNLRLSEFYKYYIASPLGGDAFSSQHNNSQNGEPRNDVRRTPHDLGVQVNQVVSPDTTLTAFCQLAAIRLGVQRCGISLISRYQQYILAESTRTTNLTDTTKSDDPEDSLWLGMTECDRHGNLCENTVALPPASASEVPPCFTVLDLRDSRFQGAPYVTGFPFMRFYCGTPISTDRGANIGSLWVLDSRALPEFTSHQKRFFGAIASLVMKHLVMTKEKSERRKAMRMSQALSAFVDGKVPLAYAKIQGTAQWSTEDHRSPADYAAIQSHEMNGHIGRGASGIDEIADLDLDDRSPAQEEAEIVENGSHESFATFEGPDVRKEHPGSAQGQEERSVLFARASFLMKDALEATGCIFLDTAIGSLAGLDESHRASGLDQTADELASSDFTASTRSNRQNAYVQRRKHSTPGLLAAAPQNLVAAEVLGYAIDNRSSFGGVSGEKDLGFTPLDEQFLLDLAANYPQGTLWSFEETGILFPAEEEPSPESFDQKRGRKRASTTGFRREVEARLLRQHFPGVRQLLFVPLYDLDVGRSTAGCFAFSDRAVRVFAVETELPFMRSFINNIAAEISRMDAFALSSSKSDFIGSISHELRSPLHGVLAACEFLSETELNNYQKSLVETQISCGKTLLQVIEQVLDFSKINSFEKDERAAKRHGSDLSSENMTSGPKMQNLFEQTDVCELCEEVVEGSVAGKAHLLATVGIQGRKPSDPSHLTDSAGKSVYGFTKNVAVILDFDYQVDWVYVVQPGALRRILMNVLGNSLKYTQAGCIRVKLSVRDRATPGSSSADVITLSVSDTGKGISKDFLRKRLFTPFNQEDSLSTGCGLGLSIVKSLTSTLNGTIEVRSEQGVGTTVSINLPLSRGSHRAASEDVMQVRHKWVELHLPSSETTVGYVGFVVPEVEGKPMLSQRESKIKESIKASVTRCMVDWLQMQSIETNADLENADYVVVLVDERLVDFLQPYVNDIHKKQPRVIALLPSEMSRREIEKALGSTIRAFEVVSAPFGPRKMARAVAACEETALTWSRTRRSAIPSDVAPLQKVKEDMEVGSEVLQAHELVQAVSSHPATCISSPVENSRPKSLTAVREKRSSEITIEPQPTTNESTSSSQWHSEVDVTTPANGGVRLRTRPRLLLVDDNLINLRFLETYVQKRRPDCDYDSAEDGGQAVKAAANYEAGYSLVFMDLSMPVMDGLEATRRIRALERERQRRLGDAAPPPALIVALTGLASGRDQANAFANGVDLFLTKPVKFKEIGKLLEDRCKA